MSFFNLFEEYSLLFGGSLLLLGITVLIIQILSLNNDKLYKKLKKSEFNETGLWIMSASLMLTGLKLIFTDTI